MKKEEGVSVLGCASCRNSGTLKLLDRESREEVSFIPDLEQDDFSSLPNVAWILFCPECWEEHKGKNKKHFR
ncbi:MAG TPA: hypothetical protein ENJ27_01065 [Candidatus Moranbacteria bacterium]|nr:hypothetical protein [Candidatus Moranbacteria bacterium]